MKPEIIKILRKRGTMAILEALAQGDLRWKDLKSRIRISDGTLSCRLKELLKLRLIEQVPKRDGSWRLHIFYRLKDKSIVSTIKTVKQILDNFDERFKELLVECLHSFPQSKCLTSYNDEFPETIEHILSFARQTLYEIALKAEEAKR